MIYGAAQKSEVSLKHRFVARGSAVMLMGKDGQRAILDMRDRHLIPDDELTSDGWSGMLDAINVQLQAQTGKPTEQPLLLDP